MSETPSVANTHSFRVIFGDTDAMGIVYYANYFRYFEAGRTEFLRAIGFPYRTLETKGYGLPVVNASARYHAPARYDDELTLTTSLTGVRFSTVTIQYRLMRDETLIATGETRHACVGPGGRVTRLPEEFAKVLGGPRV